MNKQQYEMWIAVYCAAVQGYREVPKSGHTISNNLCDFYASEVANRATGFKKEDAWAFAAKEIAEL